MEITKTDQMYALDILRSVIETFDDGFPEFKEILEIPEKLKTVERILEGRENENLRIPLTESR